MVQEKLQWILNSTYHHSINTASFTLLFGTQMREETDLTLNEIIEQEFQSQFKNVIICEIKLRSKFLKSSPKTVKLTISDVRLRPNIM